MAPNPATESLPYPRRELGSPVGDDVQRDTMQPDHMRNQEIRCVGRGREFGKGGKVNHLGEPVDHGQDGCVALGHGETRDEVQGDVTAM